MREGKEEEGSITLCFSPPERTSCQLLVVSQPPSLSTIPFTWTIARISRSISSVTPPDHQENNVGGRARRIR